MDNMLWMKPCIARRKHERETVENVAFQTDDVDVGFQSKATDVGHPLSAFTCHSQYIAAAPRPAPAGVPYDQDYHVSPFSQPTACDGSLSDMIVPYQYDKVLDDLLLEQEEQLAPIAQNELTQFSRTPQIDDSIIFTDDLDIDDNVIINDQQPASAISKCNENAQSVSPLPPLPPLAPASAQTRRPPMRKGTTPYRQNHIHSERQRRQDMASLFNRLQSVLPNMEHEDLKRDRCTILEHVIEYVQQLDKKVQALGKVKEELTQGAEGELLLNCGVAQPLHAALAAADSVSVRQWGQVDIFITLNCPKQRGLWPCLLAFLQDTLRLDVQNVALSSTPLFCVHSIYAKLLGHDNEEVCCKLKKTLIDFVTHQYAYYDRDHIMSSSHSTTS